MAEHSVTFEIFYDAAWHAVPVLSGPRITYMRGSKTPGNDTDPAAGALTIDNTSELYAPRSVKSGLYGKIGQNTKGRLSADSAVLMSGEVASWKPQRPIKGSGWTPIELAGVLRRIGRGTDPIQSAATRATVALGPVAYWPLEGGTDAITDGTLPLITNTGRSITWNDSEVLAGSLPLPKVATKDEVLSIPAGVDWPFLTALNGVANATSAMEWSIGCWVIAVPHSSAPATPIVTYALQWGSVPTGATVRGWELSIASGTGWTGAAEVLLSMNNNNYVFRGVGEIMDGQPHHLLVTAKQTSANNITITLYVDGVAYTVGSNPNPATPYTLTPVTFVYVGGEPESTGSPDQWTGHVSVFDRALTVTEVNKLYTAGLGWVGERAADRFTRFCIEEGVTPTVIGTAADSVQMGPQVPAPRLEIFDEIARTDDAQIFETKTDVGLTMRTGASKLNQGVALTLNYIGQIQPGLVPVYGDQGIRNDVTGRNPAGATGRVQQLVGPHNVQLPEDDPQGVGRYQTTLDVNPQTEAALTDAAGWRVNLGTYDGTWYAEVTVDLDAAPGLTAAVDAIDIGDIVAIANLPADEALDTVEGLVIGIGGDLPAKRRFVTFYLVPAAPYRAGKLAATSGDTDPFVGNADPDSAIVTAAIAAGASTFTVDAVPVWVTTTGDADSFPQDVVVGGQRVSISGVAPAVSDAFTRSGAWPGSFTDTGQSWTVGAGTSALFTTTGTTAQIAISAINSEHHIAVNLGYALHQRVQTQQLLNVTPTGAAINWGVMLRRADATNLYWIDVQVGTDSSLTLRAISKISGVNVQLTTFVSQTTHSTSVARILVAEIDSSNVIRAKVYAAGAAEPGWELVYQASAIDLQTGPSVGVIGRLATGNTNAAPVNLVFDDFAVLSPQTFTVRTAGFQVRYPIAAGASVMPYQPVILTQ